MARGRAVKLYRKLAFQICQIVLHCGCQICQMVLRMRISELSYFLQTLPACIYACICARASLPARLRIRAKLPVKYVNIESTVDNVGLCNLPMAQGPQGPQGATAIDLLHGHALDEDSWYFSSKSRHPQPRPNCKSYTVWRRGSRTQMGV